VRKVFQAKGLVAAAIISSAWLAAVAAPEAAQAVSTPTVTISQFAYSSLTVKAGSTIVVKNKDQTTHTFHLMGTKIDPTVAPGKSIKVKLPTKVGSYTIHCDFHPSMSGKLKITK
jgi:plastocyanin